MRISAEKLEDCRVLRAHRLWFPTSNRLETWLIRNITVQIISLVSHGLWHNLSASSQVLTSALKRSFCLERQDKVQRWYRGKLCQTMVDSCYCLYRSVLEEMIQVSRRHDKRLGTLRVLLSNPASSGTSAFAVSAVALACLFVCCCYKTRKSLLRLPPWAWSKTHGSMSTRVLQFYQRYSTTPETLYVPTEVNTPSWRVGSHLWTYASPKQVGTHV